MPKKPKYIPNRYYMVLFKPIDDPCWIYKNLDDGTKTIADATGDALLPEVLHSIVHREPILLLSTDHGWEYGTHDYDSFFKVAPTAVVEATLTETVEFYLSSVGYEFELLGNGSVNVGCHKLGVPGVRRVFQMLADFFNYKLEDWKREPKKSETSFKPPLWTKSITITKKGMVEVGMNRIDVNEVREIFQALAKHFDYELEDWEAPEIKR